MNPTAMPPIVDRATFTNDLNTLRIREKAHTREADAIAAQRRRLPMVEVDGSIPLRGAHGTVTLLDVFEGRRQLIAYYFMWSPGQPAAEQCEGCTWATSQIGELSYLHSRDITFAVLCQGRNTADPGVEDPYQATVKYRDFMGWQLPWYSAYDSLDKLLVGRQLGLFNLACYLRDGDRVFETYWTTGRGGEAMDNSYRLMDLTPYGRREPWEDSPPGWPQDDAYFRVASGAPDWAPVTDTHRGRPIAQWPRIAAGYSDDLGTAGSADHRVPEGGCCH